MRLAVLKRFKVIYILLFSMMLIVSANSYAKAFSSPADPAFQSILKNRPWFVLLGVGQSLAVGDSTYFKGTIENAKTGAKKIAALNLGTAYTSHFALGYSFRSVPVHVMLSRLELYNYISTVDDTALVGNATLGKTIYSAQAFYDYYFTEHWRASLGAGLGIMTAHADNAGDSYKTFATTRSGLAYIASAEFSYLFSRISLGVSYSFLGSTIPINKVYISSDRSGNLYDTVAGFQLGVMF
jgi:hypothetical protein